MLEAVFVTRCGAERRQSIEAPPPARVDVRLTLYHQVVGWRAVRQTRRFDLLDVTDERALYVEVADA